MPAQIPARMPALWIAASLMACSAHAHTGVSVIALPVSEIELDGDLSDWPQTFQTHALESHDSDRIVEPSDAVGQFWVGHDRSTGHLYVALRFEDDQIVLKGAHGDPWNAQDTCELFVDRDHGPGRRRPSQFFFRETYGAQPSGREQLAAVVRSVNENHLVYEWRVDLGRMGAARPLPIDDVIIGFNIGCTDRDGADDVQSLYWTPGEESWRDSTQLGDLLLMDRPVEFGAVEGKLVWGQAHSTPPRFLHVRSVGKDRFFVRATADEHGRFSVSLPPGEYDINAADPRTSTVLNPSKRIQVQPGKRTDIKGLSARSASLIDELLPLLLEEHQVPGAAVALIEDGRIQYVKTFGRGDRGRPVTRDTVFRVASLTKPVSTILALKLVASGEWELDEPLSNHWIDPDIAEDPRHRLLTSRLVLRHQGGLPNWRQRNPLSFRFDPGEAWGYSGEGFEYMRRALEAKLGRSLEDLAEALIFEPLDMQSTSYIWQPWADGRYAGEHEALEPIEDGYDKPSEPNAAADLITTIDDYARFALHVLNGAGIPDALFADMASAQARPTPPIEGAYWGIGWAIVKEPDPENYAIWHGGGQNGIRTHVLLVPEGRRGLIVFTNATQGTPIVQAVLDITLNKDGGFPVLEQILAQ